MTLQAYLEGGRVRLVAAFTTDDSPIDPSTVTFTVQTPAGVNTDYAWGTDANVTNPSTGVYYCVFDVDEVGRWRARVQGTGTVRTACETAFNIIGSEVLA